MQIKFPKIRFKSKPKQILSDKFSGGGVRGPGLIKIFWDGDTNTRIEKILFEGNSVLKFIGLQTIMITPHEVYGGRLFGDGIYDIGHSAWFRSMSSGHLDNCNHYRLFFYDEIIDVICEDIVVNSTINYFKNEHNF